jgi:hypothetical protein
MRRVLGILNQKPLAIRNSGYLCLPIESSISKIIEYPRELFPAV